MSATEPLSPRIREGGQGKLSIGLVDQAFDENTMAIVYEEVRVSYKGESGKETTALGGVSLGVPDGSFTSIIGPSGCGKTTLLRLCAGFQQAKSGRTVCNGKVVTKLNHDVGYVTQQASLYPWMTTRENVEFPLNMRGVGKAERRQRSDIYLDRMGLSSFADHYPHQLSGGMQKRASIAQTLIYEPRTILMDESFAGLDSQTRMSVEADLLRLWSDQRPTIVFVTHDITEAIALSDHVVVMSESPSRVKAVYDVQLPRPRDVYTIQSEPAFAEAYGNVWDLFRSHESKHVGEQIGKAPYIGDRCPSSNDPSGSDGSVGISELGVLSPVDDDLVVLGDARETDVPVSRSRTWFMRTYGSRQRLGTQLGRAAVLVAFFGLWELLSKTNVLDPAIFSNPVAVAKELVLLLGGKIVQGQSIYPQISTTVSEMLIGFAVGSAGGVLLGVWLARSRTMAEVIQPFILASFGVPVIAIAPIVVLVLGIGFDAKVGTAAVTTFFVVFFQTFGGVKSIGEDNFRLARLMGASRPQVARKVLIPGSLPFIFQGLRMGVPMAMTGAVIGEFIVSTAGLGAFILRTSSTFDAPDLFAALIIVLAIVAIGGQIIAIAERVLLRWLPKKTI